MLDRFFEFVDVSNNEEINTIEEFITNFGGTSFLDGLYRIYKKDEIIKWNEILGQAFPAIKGKITAFAYDWMGKCFVVFGETNTILIFEPGTGEAYDTELSFEEFHNSEIPNNHVECLASNFFLKWKKRNSGFRLPIGKCIGYKVPLFLNGDDTVDNLEVSDMEVYWEIMGSLMNM